MKRLMTVAAMVLVTACAAQARTEADAGAPPVRAEAVGRADVSCEIRATRTAHGVRLDAVAHGNRAVQGEYAFVITAKGSGGSSDISQGGPFALVDDANTIVGSAEISTARYRAVLTLTNGDGELCRLERRS